MNIRALMGGLAIGTIIALILYFFVLDREAPADSQTRLLFPAQCTIGADCWYMAYVDLDAGPGYRDYMCGIRSYDDHKGTDIAPTDGAIGTVVIVAAADGRVIGTRDGMEDTPMREAEPDREAARCGNGVRIDHGDGLVAQYCHMARGSVAVRSGDPVMAGQVLGRIGSSGWSEFPHLHFQLERDGAPLDPFVDARPAFGGACVTPAVREASLWRQPSANNADEYGDVHIRLFGMTTNLPDWDVAKFDGYAEEATTDASALVAYVVLFGAPEGAIISFEIEGPAGEDVHRNTRVVERGRAEYFAYSGRKRPDGGWPAGVYTGRVAVSGEGVSGPYTVSDRVDFILR
ncbi:MAG: M23 family metallopeptidase [Alphaproteobacteria bacterium]|nr:M23 family metallopeptidase [Alphaproteobacteria bacterium]